MCVSGHGTHPHAPEPLPRATTRARWTNILPRVALTRPRPSRPSQWAAASTYLCLNLPRSCNRTQEESDLAASRRKKVRVDTDIVHDLTVLTIYNINIHEHT